MTETYLAIVSVAASLLIIWITSFFIIRERNIDKYLPFIVLGIILLIYPSFILFELFFEWPLLFLESLIFFNLVWILIKLSGGKNDRIN